MSDARKCDVCGEYYDSNTKIYATKDGKPYNKIEVYYSHPGTTSTRHITKDLCPSCMSDCLDRYFGGADEIPEENPEEPIICSYCHEPIDLEKSDYDLTIDGNKAEYYHTQCYFDNLPKVEGVTETKVIPLEHLTKEE